MQDQKSNFIRSQETEYYLVYVSWKYLYHRGYHEKAAVFWLSFTDAISLEVLMLLSIGNKNFLPYLHHTPQPLLDIQCPLTGMKLLEMPLRWSALQIHLYLLKKSYSPINRRHPNQARQRVSSFACEKNILTVTFFRFVSTEVSNLEANQWPFLFQAADPNRPYEGPIHRYRTQQEPPSPQQPPPPSSQAEGMAHVPRTHRLITLADHICVGFI